MKEIWILNHYAANQFLERGGRHYYFAKYLKQAGYQVKIFCASTVHNSEKNLISDGRLFSEDTCDGIPFIFIKARSYHGNGKQRVLNMLDYYRGMLKIAHQFEKPDVIIGSSVHPLACVAAIRLGKKFRCKAIAEIRDLWPESIVAYHIAKKNNPVIHFLYGLERWIYKKADVIIFTMEGSRDYIVEKRWDKDHGGPVDLDKVYHINNGIDLEMFDYNREHYTIDDPDIEDESVFKVVYTGSIRLTNNLDILVQTAKIAKEQGIENLIFIVYGEGNQKERLEKLCCDWGLSNIKFKGAVDKKYVPYILSKSSVNLLDMYFSPIFRYGVSPNKLFEYLAAGKPIVSGLICSYDIIKKYQCGIVVRELNAEELYHAIQKVYETKPEKYAAMAERAADASKIFDFKVLTQELISIIEEKT